jgi:hypothetical protein
MVRRCDADGNGYICSEEFHDLCQEFDISQASSSFSRVEKKNIQSYIVAYGKVRTVLYTSGLLLLI